MVRQVPELIHRLQQDHWATREEAAQALEALGAEEDGEALGSEVLVGLAVPRIGRCVEEINWHVRRAAANALGHLSESKVWGRSPGTAARGAVPELARRLASEDLHVRRAAKEPFSMLCQEGGLGDVHAVAAGAVPGLLKQLQDEDWLSREAAARALAHVGAAAAPALPELARRLADDSDRVRKAAKATLEHLGNESSVPDLAAACAPAVPSLVGRLQEKDWRIRCTAAYALGAYGGSAAVAGPMLLEALSDSSRCIRELAAEALGNMGVVATPALPELCSRLGDMEESVRTSATLAIRKIHSALSSRDRSIHESLVVSRLLRKLADVQPVERIGIAQNLAELGVEALPAVPHLAGALLDDNALVSEAMSKALARLREQGLLGDLGLGSDMDRPPPEPLGQRLSSALELDGERWEVRLAAAEALALLTLRAARVVQPLARRLQGEGSELAEGAKEVLRVLGQNGALLDVFSAAEDAAPTLVEMFASEEPLVHALASEALRKLHAAGLLDDLEQRLAEMEEYLADAARASGAP